MSLKVWNFLIRYLHFLIFSLFDCSQQQMAYVLKKQGHVHASCSVSSAVWYVLVLQVDYCALKLKVTFSDHLNNAQDLNQNS